MLLKLCRAPAIVGALALTLAGCGSMRGLTSKDAPRCSGNERRPLNADLWEWKTATPLAPGQPTAPGTGALGYGASPVAAPASAAIDMQIRPADAPRWDIAVSLEPCGEPQ